MRSASVDLSLKPGVWMTMASTAPNPFPQDALEPNRAGRLTQPQRKGLRRQSRGFHKAELQFTVLLTIIGLLVWFAEGPARNATVNPPSGSRFSSSPASWWSVHFSVRPRSPRTSAAARSSRWKELLRKRASRPSRVEQHHLLVFPCR